MKKRIASAAAVAVTLAGLTALAPGRADALVNVTTQWQGSTLLGRAQNAPHRWGACDVQDYNGGAWGWYMRVGRPFSYDDYTVHHGMFAGYTANGGAAGLLKCPTSNEYAFAGGSRQDFQGGVLHWLPGMGAGQVTSVRMANAISFAMSYIGQWGGEACKAAGLGSGGYVAGTSGGQCRQFVSCVLYKVAGINPAYGYAATGAVRITDRNAVRPGDIIQTTSPHTAIVIRNIGNGAVEVVDSNWGLTERVSRHTWTIPTNAEIWRY